MRPLTCSPAIMCGTQWICALSGKVNQTNCMWTILKLNLNLNPRFSHSLQDYLECISNQTCPALSSEDKDSLFGNIQDIYHFNRYSIHQYCKGEEAPVLTNRENLHWRFMLTVLFLKLVHDYFCFVYLQHQHFCWWDFSFCALLGPLIV